MILSAIADKLKRRSKDDFKGRHFEASLILEAVSWCLLHPLSYHDIEERFLERGLKVDHPTSRARSLPRRRPGAQPAPSRPEACRAASASYRRIPPARSYPTAASSCPQSRTGAMLPPIHHPERAYFSISPTDASFNA
jgi:hypothetical protein